MPSFELTEQEIGLFSQIPEEDLVGLAAELDLAVPAEINVEELVLAVLVALLERARSQGLPFSSYDREDLEALPANHLSSLANLLGTPADVGAILKVGIKVYKRHYRGQRERSSILLLLPTMLPALARIAYAAPPE